MNKQQLITELNELEAEYDVYRAVELWDNAQAAALAITNICRRLELLKIQEAQEASL